MSDIPTRTFHVLPRTYTVIPAVTYPSTIPPSHIHPDASSLTHSQAQLSSPHAHSHTCIYTQLVILIHITHIHTIYSHKPTALSPHIKCDTHTRPPSPGFLPPSSSTARTVWSPWCCRRQHYCRYQHPLPYIPHLGNTAAVPFGPTDREYLRAWRLEQPTSPQPPEGWLWICKQNKQTSHVLTISVPCICSGVSSVCLPGDRYAYLHFQSITG